MPSETLSFTTEDVDYLHHGDRAMRLRYYRPAGPGPFPVIIDLHGGAWCKGDYEECGPRDELLAEAGIAAVALDFRHAGDGYPSSLIDINYAVRWLKANAGRFDIDANRVGLAGQSSGGHLAMLSAMRPDDPRYMSIRLEGVTTVNATVRCVAMLWPVINSLSRYRHALRATASANPPKWVGDIPQRHDLYWVDEARMAEGNPVLALESGEAVETPPALWIQGRPDPVHDYRDPGAPVDLNEPERFAQAYRKAGGTIDLLYVDQAKRAMTDLAPSLVSFLKKHL